MAIQRDCIRVGIAFVTSGCSYQAAGLTQSVSISVAYELHTIVK